MSNGCEGDDAFSAASNNNNQPDQMVQSTALTSSSAPGDDIRSFWEVSRYRYAVKRIEDGYKRCSDLSSFLQERADCERTFARQLRTSSRRWAEILQSDRGAESGTTLSAWTAFLAETDRTADIHATIADRLREVVDHVKAWQKNNYVRSVISNRTVKEYEEDFRKAQKPWAKAFARMIKCKKDYYNACRALKNAESQKDAAEARVTSSSSGVSGLTPPPPTSSGVMEARRKAFERFERVSKEVDTAETRYKSTIEELEQLMPSYIEQMTSVFEKTQAFERERLRFFKEVFKGSHSSLDMSKCVELEAIYTELAVCIEAADADADTDSWSRMYGARMPMIKPQFEQFEDGREPATTAVISRKAFPAPVQPKSVPGRIGFTRIMDQLASTNHNNDDRSTVLSSSTGAFYPDVNNPFSDDEQPNSSAAVPVKAIYDYAAQEPDELSLRAGMQFLMIENKDEQGWCRGRFGSKEGLYPASYAKPI